MPNFYNRERKYVLSTNYKVMYSTLTHQENLSSINKKKLLLFKYCFWIRFYLLVRDPYTRLESFYKDKFINHPLSEEYDENYGWQHSQRIFFPYLDLKETDSFDHIKNTLISTKFSDFITMLPNVFLKDRHLVPQNHISRVRYRALTFHIQYRKILKVEDKDAISWLNKYLGVNTKVRYNTTEHVNDEIVWDSRSVEIVNQLYYEDFREYKYTMKSPA